MTEPTTVAIVGQGYVGLPLAMQAVAASLNVVGYDIDEARIEVLRAGRSFIDDIDHAIVADALAAGRYVPTADAADLRGFDVAVISVPTPLRSGQPDLSFVESATHVVGRHLGRGKLVVLESTTYPGTTTELVAPILEAESGLTAATDFHLGYSPERIDPSNVTWKLHNTPKVVSGVDPASLEAVVAFYSQFVDTVVPVSSPRVAELTKLLENTFRHVNIALVNELAMYAHDLDIDVWEAIDAATTKPFGFMRFTPGPGVGGHCLPVDPAYLAWSTKETLGRSFRFVELANRVNAAMPEYVVARIERSLAGSGRSLPESRILLLGLAYKPNTGDARESAAVRVAEGLVATRADVRVVDSRIAEFDIPTNVTRVKLNDDEVAAADLVVVLVAHDDLDLDLVARRASRVLDCQNRIRGPNVELL